MSQEHSDAGVCDDAPGAVPAGLIRASGGPGRRRCGDVRGAPTGCAGEDVGRRLYLAQTKVSAAARRQVAEEWIEELSSKQMMIGLAGVSAVLAGCPLSHVMGSAPASARVRVDGHRHSGPARAGATRARRAFATTCTAQVAWIRPVSASTGGGVSVCLSSATTQTEAWLRVTNGRDHPQLIVVTGARVDLDKSSFGDRLAAHLARRSAALGAGLGGQPIALASGERVLLAIDRPPPRTAVQTIAVRAAPTSLAALSALTFALLRAAGERFVTPRGLKRCLEREAYAATAGSAHAAATAIARLRRCVQIAPYRTRRARRVARSLARQKLRVARFDRLRATLRAEDRASSPAAFAVAASPPGALNPAIRLDQSNLGSLPEGRRTLIRLRATGGIPPYRYYLIEEPGRPAVPSWVSLAADGMLTIEPPVGADASVRLSVYVVDASGAYSQYPGA
jgi:hypothetical protein